MKCNIEGIFRSLIFLLCLGVVLWQCWKCGTKFVRKPKGTHISVIKPTMFPSVTICPQPFTNTTLNTTTLSKCGITWKQYFKSARWSNQGIENCTNPKSLFYEIIWNPEDLISKFGIRGYDFNSYIVIFPNDSNPFRHIDIKGDECLSERQTKYSYL